MTAGAGNECWLAQIHAWNDGWLHGYAGGSQAVVQKIPEQAGWLLQILVGEEIFS